MDQGIHSKRYFWYVIRRRQIAMTIIIIIYWYKWICYSAEWIFRMFQEKNETANIGYILMINIHWNVDFMKKNSVVSILTTSSLWFIERKIKLVSMAIQISIDSVEIVWNCCLATLFFEWIVLKCTDTAGIVAWY